MGSKKIRMIYAPNQEHGKQVTIEDVPQEQRDRFSLTDAPGKDAYPIVSATWQLVWKNPTGTAGQSKGTAASLVTWLKYELGDGQDTTAELGYAPLPDALRKQALAAVDSIELG